MLIFLVFYKLCLEREKFHQLKRIYLLLSLPIALIIPLITYTTHVDAILPAGQGNTILQDNDPFAEGAASFDWGTLLWYVYGVGVLLFGLRFLYHMMGIVFEIKNNLALKKHKFTHVLMRKEIYPHTFFNYLFFNKQQYQSQSIPSEVILHEEAHAQQKHSFDILFIELLQVVFWFNPIIRLYRSAIKLNHEFLADTAVLDRGIETTTYQKILLRYTSTSCAPVWAHHINHSSTRLSNELFNDQFGQVKKRLTIMKSNAKKGSLRLRGMALLPLLALMLYGFSTKKEVTRYADSPTTTNAVVDSSATDATHTARSITIEILADKTYKIDGTKATKNTLVSNVHQLHQDLSPALRNRLMNIHLISSDPIPNEEVWFIYNSLLDYGFHRLVTKEQEVVRSKGNTPFALETNDSPSQEGITQEQLDEYNALAKKYNEQPRNKRFIKMKELRRLEYLYKQMSAGQRKAAEPFPDCAPPPPPPPPPGASEALVKRYNSTIEEYKQKYPEMVKELGVQKVKGSAENIPQPPPPPPPPEPEDHIKEMMAKNALFYYEGNKITGERALQIVRGDGNLSIQTKSDNGKTKVYLRRN